VPDVFLYCRRTQLTVISDRQARRPVRAAAEQWLLHRNVNDDERVQVMSSNGVHAEPLHGKVSFIYLLVVAVDNTHGSPGTIFGTDHVLSAMCKLWKKRSPAALAARWGFGCVLSRPFLP
jgi:hypothetical protein